MTKKLIVVLLAVCIFTAGCIDFPHGDYIQNNAKKLEKQFPQSLHFIETGERTLSYFFHPNDHSNWLVVFIHGSPGGAEGYAYFLLNQQLRADYSLITVDRLGYERKNNAGPERSLSKQASAIHSIVGKHSKNKKVILVGHSFGGPVISQLAADYPQTYNHLVMVAASVDPALEKTKWFQIPANWRIFRWLVPQGLDTSNQEILALKNELLKLTPRAKKTNPKVFVIHGTDDKLVPYENVAFIKDIYGKNVIEVNKLEGVNHFIPWSHPETIIQAVNRLAQ